MLYVAILDSMSMFDVML